MYCISIFSHWKKREELRSKSLRIKKKRDECDQEIYGSSKTDQAAGERVNPHKLFVREEKILDPNHLSKQFRAIGAFMHFLFCKDCGNHFDSSFSDCTSVEHRTFLLYKRWV